MSSHSSRPIEDLFHLIYHMKAHSAMIQETSFSAATLIKTLLVLPTIRQCTQIIASRVSIPTSQDIYVLITQYSLVKAHNLRFTVRFSLQTCQSEETLHAPYIPPRHDILHAYKSCLAFQATHPQSNCKHSGSARLLAWCDAMSSKKSVRNSGLIHDSTFKQYATRGEVLVGLSSHTNVSILNLFQTHYCVDYLMNSIKCGVARWYSKSSSKSCTVREDVLYCHHNRPVQWQTAGLPVPWHEFVLDPSLEPWEMPTCSFLAWV